MLMNRRSTRFKAIQKKMGGRAETAGIRDNEDIVKLVREVRSGRND
jgi:hypothetical protein